MDSGIYCLYFDKDIKSRYYIGMSSQLSKRYNKHCSHLKNNTHSNYKLQEYYNTNIEIPEFHIIEFCNNISAREIFWIEEFDSYNTGFNLTKGGEGFGSGTNHRNSIYTKEQIEKVFLYIIEDQKTLKNISEITGVDYSTVRDISCGKSHLWLKDVFPNEYNDLLSITRSSKIHNDSKYIEVFKLLVDGKLSKKEISHVLDISYQIVRNIAYGSNHRYLKDMFPEEYEVMLKNNGTKIR